MLEPGSERLAVYRDPMALWFQSQGFLDQVPSSRRTGLGPLLKEL